MPGDEMEQENVPEDEMQQETITEDEIEREGTEEDEIQKEDMAEDEDEVNERYRAEEDGDDDDGDDETDAVPADQNQGVKSEDVFEENETATSAEMAAERDQGRKGEHSSGDSKVPSDGTTSTPTAIKKEDVSQSIEKEQEEQFPLPPLPPSESIAGIEKKQMNPSFLSFLDGASGLIAEDVPKANLSARASTGTMNNVPLSDAVKRAGAMHNLPLPDAVKRSDKWYEMFEELKKYKETYGDCMVPRTHANNRRLGEWVKTQRRSYRQRQEGKSSAMTKLREKTLESIGFKWRSDPRRKRSLDELVAVKPKYAPPNKKRKPNSPKQTVVKNDIVSDRDEKWQLMLEELVNYKTEHGDCMVRRTYAAHPRLGEWVKNQRRAYKLKMEGKASAMTKERIEALEAFGFCWKGERTRNNQPRKSISKPLTVKSSEVKTGLKYEDVVKQVSHPMKVTPTRPGALKTISNRDEKWTEMFEELKIYKGEHGHCCVPRTFNHPKSLGEWVKTQRRTYKLRIEGKSSAMTKNRIDALEALGFCWKQNVFSAIPNPNTAAGQNALAKTETVKSTPKKKKAPVTHDGDATLESLGMKNRDEVWQEIFSQLKKYKAEHGDCFVPRTFAENPRLGEWCKRQRRAFKQRLSGTSSAMTQERVDALESIGFSWSGFNRTASPGTKSSKTNTTPKKSPKKPTASQAVENVGSSFHTMNDRDWISTLEELFKFKLDHGHLNVPVKYPACPKLLSWMNFNRKQYSLFKQGKPCSLTTERIAYLNNLGFNWEVEVPPPRMIEDKHASKWESRLNELRGYKKEHGSTLVSKRDPKNSQLYSWVSQQRTQFRLLKQGKASSMTKERIDALEKMGFFWSLNERRVPNMKGNEEEGHDEEQPYEEGDNEVEQNEEVTNADEEEPDNEEHLYEEEEVTNAEEEELDNEENIYEEEMTNAEEEEVDDEEHIYEEDDDEVDDDEVENEENIYEEDDDEVDDDDEEEEHERMAIEGKIELKTEAEILAATV